MGLGKMDDDNEGGSLLEDLINKGVQLLQNKNPEEAEICFKRALEMNPESDIVHRGFTFYYHATGNMQLALKEAEIACRIDSENPYNLSNLGNILFLSENYDRAILYLKKAIEKGAKNPHHLHYSIGTIFQRNGRNKEAVDHFMKAEEMGFKNTELYNKMGSCFRQLKRFDEAEETFKKALEINPKFESAYLGLGNIYLNKGDLEKAESAFLKSLELNNDNKNTLNSLAGVYFKRGEYEKSIFYFDKAIEAGYDLASGLISISSVLILQDKKEDAVRLLKEASKTNDSTELQRIVHISIVLNELELGRDICNKILSIDPNDHLGYFSLGRIECKKNNLKRAEQLFKKAISLDDCFTDSFSWLSKVYNEMGKPDKALACIKEGFKITQNDAGLFLNEGYSHLLEKKYAEATVCFERARELDPTNFEPAHGLGVVSLERGDYSNAEKKFDEALAIFYKESASHHCLGVIRFKQGRFKEAEKKFLEALSIDGSYGPPYNGLALVYMEMKRFPEALYNMTSAIALEPNRIIYRRNLVELLNKINSVDDVIGMCGDFLKENPSFSGMNHILAMLLDFVYDSGEEAEPYYHKMIEMMKNDPNFMQNLRNYGNSTNPVKVDSFNPITEKMFFIKCNDGKRSMESEKTRLKNEFAIKTFVSNALKMYNPASKIEKPVAFFGHSDGNIYLITKTEGRRNLRDAGMEDGYDNPAMEENVLKCLLTLAEMHGVITKELDGTNKIDVFDGRREYKVVLGKFDYQHDLNRRLFDRFGHSKDSEKLSRLMLDFIRGETIGQDFFIHGDMYETNALEGGSIVDYEKCCLGDPTLDAAGTLNNPSFNFDPMGPFEGYYNHFVECYDKQCKFADFKRSFFAHRFFYSIGFAGSRFFHKDYDVAQKLADRAIGMMEEKKFVEMKKSFIDYMGGSLKRK
ncbi:hypothetical protein COV19_06185 [Candidatus Woesearchaeota archaeon CG10_big_fil_rev_8_21_14_0_10_44_13]|nr:MAG: hypothetical protein COV19_06185 [Candidatus Woesearchaeota archaeon CG10_big_fil_rev_8_21_14_0_10_44_13]